MEHPKLPPAQLVAEHHVGTLKYFQDLKRIVGSSTPEVWVGFEALREVEDESAMTPLIAARVAILRQELEIRGQLAGVVGLTTKRQAFMDIKGVNIDVTMDDFVEGWGAVKVHVTRLINAILKKRIAKCTEGDQKALKQCRKYVASMFTGVASATSNPAVIKRYIQTEARRNNRAFSLLLPELRAGREGRLVMGALHIPGVQQLLESEGYKVRPHSERWVPCVELAQLA